MENTLEKNLDRKIVNLIVNYFELKVQNIILFMWC